MFYIYSFFMKSASIFNKRMVAKESGVDVTFENSACDYFECNVRLPSMVFDMHL